MAKKYLDDVGLAHLWDKIKSFVKKENTKIPFGQVDSTSTSKVFTATIPEITELADGVCVYLKNGVVTSESGFTLNINGLGAKPVYGTLASATRATTLFNVNYTLLFVYNSSRVEDGCWDAYYGYDSNTNTIGYQLRTNSMSLPVSGATYRYRIVFTSADGTHYVPANTSSSTNATSSRAVNQTPIDPFGEIRYYSYTSAVSSGSRISASYLWEQNVLVLGYSFNRTGSALTLTSWKPVYIKCTPQTDGSAIMDADTPYVQALPSTEDGKIYIFLGVAYDATHIELVPHHPVYYYKDSAIRIWTNTSGSDFSGSYNDLTDKPTIPSKTSDLTNDSGFISTETDPTVPSWAKASTKPTYTASEVGALPDTTIVPTNTSQLNNDSSFVSTFGGDTSSKTPTEVAIATSAGKTISITHTDQTYGLLNFCAFNRATSAGLIVSTVSFSLNGVIYLYTLVGNTQTDVWTTNVSLLAQTSDIPTVPTDVSAFNNDAGYITGYTETDPTVPSWAKASTKPSYTASEVGAISTGGGQITGDITLYVASGNSPAIIFQRGTLTDNFNDWKIYDKSGFLYFAQRGSGSSDFGDVGYIDTGGVLRSFTIPWGSVTGKPAQLPTVTTSDNGKVLRVVNGAWSAVALPSASGVSF